MFYKFQSLVITFILFSFAILYAKADYSQDYEAVEIWDNIWYICEAFMFFLLALCIAFLNYENNYKGVWLLIAVFLFVRFIWEIIAVAKGLSVNDKKAICVIFILICTTVLCLTYLPFIRKTWQKLK